MLALGTLNMNSLAVRLASFLSACLILLTAFHVMVSAVSYTHLTLPTTSRV